MTGVMMERYARGIVRHPKLVLAAVLVATALVVAQLPELRFEIRRRAQLPQEHPYVQVHHAIADLFGGETTVIIGLVPHAGDIFTPDMLGKVERITRGLERQRGVVVPTLLSLAADRVKAIRPSSEGIDVRPLLREVPDSPEALRALRADVLGDPIYAGSLVARDGGATAIVVDFDDQLTDGEVYRAVEAVLAPERDGTVDIALGGAPLMRAYIGEYTRQMAWLFLAAVVIIGLVHYEAFRTVQAMLLPLVTALLSVTWALGFLAWWGEPLDTWSALTPIVVLAVAAGHAVQILKRYYEECERGHASAEAVVRSLVAVGPVMITAGTIAAAGFASLVTFGVATVRVFGLTLALGILSSLAIEMTFIPACRVLMPAPRTRTPGATGRVPLLGRLLAGLGQLTTRYPRHVLTATVAVVGVALVGAARVHVNNSFHEWFPAESQLRTDDALLNARLAGTSTLYVLLEGRGEGDLLSPPVVRALGDLEDWLERQPHVGAALSVYDYIRQMHAAMTGESRVPDDPALIEQYLFLYSMSGPDQLGSLVDAAHRHAVLRAYVKTDQAEYGSQLLDDLRQFARARFAGLPVAVRIGGGALGVQSALNEVVVRQKLINIAQIDAIIFTLSALALRSVAGGLLVITPLVVAAAVILGLMGYSDTWLSVGTATVTAMAISIGADFAIYLVYRIREEIRAGGDVAAAVRRALDTAGAGICFVASAVVLGYLVLALSDFRLWVHLGVLTAMMMAVSAVAALTVVPALVTVLRPRFLVGSAAAARPHGLAEAGLGEGDEGAQPAEAVARDERAAHSR